MLEALYSRRSRLYSDHRANTTIQQALFLKFTEETSKNNQNIISRYHNPLFLLCVHDKKVYGPHNKPTQTPSTGYQLKCNLKTKNEEKPKPKKHST